MPVLRMLSAVSASSFMDGLEQGIQGGKIICCLLLDVRRNILDHQQALSGVKRESNKAKSRSSRKTLRIALKDCLR